MGSDGVGGLNIVQSNWSFKSCAMPQRGSSSPISNEHCHSGDPGFEAEVGLMLEVLIEDVGRVDVADFVVVGGEGDVVGLVVGLLVGVEVGVLAVGEDCLIVEDVGTGAEDEEPDVDVTVKKIRF